MCIRDRTGLAVAHLAWVYSHCCLEWGFVTQRYADRFGLQLRCSPFIPCATAATYTKAATVFLPSFHYLSGGFSLVLLLQTTGVRVYLGRAGCYRGRNPHD